jgi:hypothetical protein
LMLAETAVVLDLQHGSVAGRRVRFLASAAGIESVEEGDVDGEASLDLTLGLSAALGSNAEWSVVLS